MFSYSFVFFPLQPGVWKFVSSEHAGYISFLIKGLGIESCIIIYIFVNSAAFLYASQPPEHH